MNQVVYTGIDRIEDLGAATWRTGVELSYERTQHLADRDFWHCEIRVVARTDKRGNNVQVIAASSGRRAWRKVNTSHLKLAQMFARRLDEMPALVELTPFFHEINDPSVAQEAARCVNAACGANTPYERSGEVHMEILAHCHKVCAIGGLPVGDWMFIPFANAARPGTFDSTYKLKTPVQCEPQDRCEQ